MNVLFVLSAGIKTIHSPHQKNKLMKYIGEWNEKVLNRKQCLYCVGVMLFPSESVVNPLLNLMRVTWDKTEMPQNNYFKGFKKKM